MSLKPTAWSFTALSDFENCPKQFYHKRVAKDVKEEMGDAALWGDNVHKFFEYSIMAYQGLPIEAAEATAILQGAETDFATYKPYLEAVLSLPADELFAERQYAITKHLVPCDWFAKDVWCRGIIDVLAIKGSKAYALDWKGLPLTTPLPTPTGWTTMGEVAVGDTLYAESGEECRVVGKSSVKHLPCYQITFDDTSKVVCDNEHLWKLHDGQVVSITSLRPKDRILVAAPLACADAALPVDPYVLGLWLADGKHTSGEITKPDREVWEEVVRRGYAISHDYSARAKDGKCRVHTVFGLRKQLKQLGVLGNKRIPAEYLRAGYSQRLALLHGLMDGDGNANPARKQCVFTSTSKSLSDAVVELLLSLGQRPLQSVVQARGFGKTVEAYPVSFRPIGIAPFLLPRKRDRVLASWGPGKSAVRTVVEVVEVPSVPTQCIAVDSADHTFLCTRRMIPTHNTGKRKPNSRQLKLFALLVFMHHPQINTVKTEFVWLKTGERDAETYTRDQEAELWQEFVPSLARFKAAFKAEVFPPRTSGLCNGWCPVTQCPHWKPKKLK